jgi:hypothetical protein
VEVGPEFVRGLVVELVHLRRGGSLKWRLFIIREQS